MFVDRKLFIYSLSCPYFASFLPNRWLKESAESVDPFKRQISRPGICITESLGRMNGRDTNSPVPEPVVSRQTSFVRSFFQAGAHHAALHYTESDSIDDDYNNENNNRSVEANPSAAEPLHRTRAPRTNSEESIPPPPTGRICRRASLALFEERRSTSQRISSKGTVSHDSSGGIPLTTTTITTGTLEASINSVRQSLGDDVSMDSSDDELRHMSLARKQPPPEQTLERQDSWIRDAMQQGEGIDQDSLRQILGIETEARPGGELIAKTFDDDEIMEQYRIMAIFQARQLFKEKLGCEVEDYEEQRHGGQKTSASTAEENDREVRLQELERPPLYRPSGPWSHSILEERLTASKKSFDIPMPPLPPVDIEKLFSSDNQSAEIETAEILPRGHVIPSSSSPRVTIKCLRCKSLLQAKPTSSLLICPTCSAVNPNTATR